MTNHPSDITATVFTRAGCMKCRVTYRKLESLGIPVAMEPLDDHPDRISHMRAQGWAELPLVEVIIDGEPHIWAGMSQDNLDALGYLRRAS